MSLYVYCVSEELRPGAVAGVPGISNAECRIVALEDLSIVVSEIDPGAISITPQNVLAHEKVIERVLSELTPLPFRFGTVVSPDQLSAYIQSNIESLRAALDHVRGAVEMSLKVMWRESPSTSAVETERADIQTIGPGTAFMEKKRRELARVELGAAQGREIGKWLEERLGIIARGSVIHQMSPGTRALSVSYLVDRNRLPDYREEVSALVNERNDLRILTSGPWPPYSFSATSL